MRLIDAEGLMEDIQKTITEQSGTIDWLNMIYRQPVAYDVDKVVKLLEKAAEEIENIYGRETEFSEEIRDLLDNLNQQVPSNLSIR